MKKFNLIALVLVLILQLSFISSLTGSIGNARVVLYPEVGFFGTTLERTILVKNVNDYSINVSVNVAEEYKDVIKIIDSEFTLEPGEEKDAAFEIRIKKAGDYEYKVNVLFAPQNGNGAGVALSSTIIIHARGESNYDSDVIDNNNTYVIDDTNNNSNVSGAMIFALITTGILILALIFLVVYASKIKRGKLKTIKRSKKV